MAKMTDRNKNTGYTTRDIEKYLNGELTPREMHDLEKASLEDPFLGDALEGFKNDRQRRDDTAFGRDMQDLARKIEDRVENETRKSPPSIPLRRAWWVAASVALLAGVCAVSYFTFVGHRITNQSLATNKRPLPGENGAPAPSSAAPEPPPSGSSPTKDFAQAAVPASLPPASVGRQYLSKADTRNDQKDTRNNEKKTWNDENGISAGKPAKNKAPVEMRNSTPAIQDTASGDDQNVFAGTVVSTNGKPVAFASISLKNQPDAATTDSSGSFRLRLSNSDSIVGVTVRSAGYASVSTVLRNNQNMRPDNSKHRFSNNSDGQDKLAMAGNQIRLQPENDMALKQITGNSYSLFRRKQPTAVLSDDEAEKKLTGDSENTPGKRAAQPSGGWSAYHSYLETSKKITTSDSILTGNEIISFIVSRSGKLSSFRVEQSLSPAHDTETIGLIKRGPAWKLQGDKKARTTLIIAY